MNLYGVGNDIVKFNGLNYEEWSEKICFHLGFIDLDLVLIMDEKLAIITETSSEEDNSSYHAWDKSNRLGVSLMKITLAKNVKSSIPRIEDPKEFMEKVKEYSQSDITDKSIVSGLMNELTTKKFDWSPPVHDHVTRMANLAAKLKSMGMDVSEYFLVQFIMNSLPIEFVQFQVNYNTIKEKMELYGN